MKKYLLLALVLTAGIVFADTHTPKFEIIGSIDPVSKVEVGVTSSSITIPSAGGGIRNCLTEIDMMATGIADMKIIDGSLAGGTTLWRLASVPANSRVFTDGILETALCGSTSTQMIISITTTTVTSASINVRGYIRKSP